MQDKYSRIKTVTMLALPPLLFATGNLYTALLYSVPLLFSGFLIRFVARGADCLFTEQASWIFIWGFGFSLINFFYIVIPELFPSFEQYLNLYFLLLGVTPLLYADCKNKKWNNFLKNNGLFLFLMIFLAVVREFLGQGSILSRELISTPPLEIFARPSGAFLLLACGGLVLEIIYRRLWAVRPVDSHAEEGTESEASI